MLCTAHKIPSSPMPLQQVLMHGHHSQGGGWGAGRSDGDGGADSGRFCGHLVSRARAKSRIRDLAVERCPAVSPRLMASSAFLVPTTSSILESGNRAQKRVSHRCHMLSDGTLFSSQIQRCLVRTSAWSHPRRWMPTRRYPRALFTVLFARCPVATPATIYDACSASRLRTSMSVPLADIDLAASPHSGERVRICEDPA